MSPRTAALFLSLTLIVSGCAHRAEQNVWLTSTKDGPAEFETEVTPHDARAPTPAPHVSPVMLKPVELPHGPKAVADIDGPYLLDTGDRLRVFVFGQPDLSRLYTVDHSGSIFVPLIGRVRARARTVSAVAGAIRARLARSFVRDPQVTVDIHQNRPFFILGEVRSPGQYPYVSGMTIKTAVAIAGGYSDRAKTGMARVTRRINGVVEVLDVPSDYVLKPGDTIEVPERFL